MKRALIYASIGLLALASGALIARLQAQQLRPAANAEPPPTIPAPTVTPEVIQVRTPTQVIVTVPISDPRVIPTGVNLLRVNTMGSPTNLGRMYDDGTRGDTNAGDTIFTFQTEFNELQLGPIQLLVSVPFRGFLRRAISGAAIIEVLPVPPLGSKTYFDSKLEITFNYPNSLEPQQKQENAILLLDPNYPLLPPVFELIILTALSEEETLESRSQLRLGDDFGTASYFKGGILVDATTIHGKHFFFLSDTSDRAIEIRAESPDLFSSPVFDSILASMSF